MAFLLPKIIQYSRLLLDFLIKFPLLDFYSTKKMTQNDTEKKAAQPTIFRQLYGFSGNEASGTRTPDNLIKSQVLYHLS